MATKKKKKLYGRVSHKSFWSNTTKAIDLEEDITLRPERYISSESQPNMYRDKPFGHEIISLINQRQFPSDNHSS